jgi:Nucleotidyl transferase AbiEii toxin, Type IV TA system
VTNAIEAALRRIVTDLDSLPASWALIGGFAVSARSEPRFTRDIDVCVLVADDVGAERVVAALVTHGYRVHTLVEQDAVGRLATVRMSGPRGDSAGVVIDLLFASSGIEAEIVAAAENVEILPGLTAPIARAGHLVALKLLARDDETRPQDAADLIALRPVLSARDRVDVHEAVRLVVERGYHRGRDLAGLLAAYLGGG